MSVTSPDFESGAYTDFATPAGISNNKDVESGRQLTGAQWHQYIAGSKNRPG
jgi:hypothetical protein